MKYLDVGKTANVVANEEMRETRNMARVKHQNPSSQLKMKIKIVSPTTSRNLLVLLIKM